MTILIIDDSEFTSFQGQEIGRELELELTAVVTKVELMPQEGGSPSSLVTLAVLRADIAQTT